MFAALAALQQLRASQALWHSVWPGTTVIKNKKTGSQSGDNSGTGNFNGHNAKAIMESWTGSGDPAPTSGGNGSEGAGMFGNSVRAEHHVKLVV